MKTIICVMLLGCCLLPAPVRAESSFDIYLGQVSTDTNRFTHTDSGGFTFSTSDSFDDGRAFGIRACNWAASHPALGLALDFSYFRPDGEVTAVDTLPLSLLFSLRAPSGSSGFAPPRSFFYLSLGPSLVLFDMHARLPVGDTFKGLGADLGLDARAGIKWRISGNAAFFIEYRHTRFDVDGTYEDVFGWVRESIAMTIESDHVNFGFSF